MKALFADTGYWIAVLNPKDQLHDKANSASKNEYPFRTVTSEWVLSEFLNHFAERGEHLRSTAATMVDRLRDDPNVEIRPATSVGFREALDLYRERPDKGWSLTDCTSIQVMRELGISKVLAHDDHFAQAGFETLL